MHEYCPVFDVSLTSCHQGSVSWRPTTVNWQQSSQSNRHSTIGTRQTEYYEALPSSANVQSHLTSSFANDGNASWYSVCRVPMVEWRLDCENCHCLTVVGLHDTSPRFPTKGEKNYSDRSLLPNGFCFLLTLNSVNRYSVEPICRVAWAAVQKWFDRFNKD